jgi:hypothetical protein
MSKIVSTHPDGSNCYTRNCKRAQGIAQSPFDQYVTSREKTSQNVSQDRLEDVEFTLILNEAVDAMASEEWPEDYARNTEQLLISLYKRHGVPNVGRTRAVFKTGNGEVIKVAFTAEGELANGTEVQASNQDDPFIPIAKTRWGHEAGVDFTIMEEVEVVSQLDYRKQPQWVGYVDSGQVGYTKAGKLVAYDL